MDEIRLDEWINETVQDNHLLFFLGHQPKRSLILKNFLDDKKKQKKNEEENETVS